MQKVFKSQKDAIIYALFKGEKLSCLNSFLQFGCTKIATRIREYEKDINFTVKAERIEFKTRFGTSGNYNVYSLDRLNNDGVMNVVKYLDDRNLLSIITTGVKTDKERYKQTSILDAEYQENRN